MSETGFWDIPDVSAAKTPLSILREQATALTTATGGLLRGSVAIAPTGNGDSRIVLSIFVPALNNYKIEIMAYYQPLLLYPGFVESANGGNIQIKNEVEFVLEVKKILQSEWTKMAVGSLLAQSQESTPTAAE